MILPRAYCTAWVALPPFGRVALRYRVLPPRAVGYRRAVLDSALYAAAACRAPALLTPFVYHCRTINTYELTRLRAVLPSRCPVCLQRAAPRRATNRMPLPVYLRHHTAVTADFFCYRTRCYGYCLAGPHIPHAVHAHSAALTLPYRIHALPPACGAACTHAGSGWFLLVSDAAHPSYARLQHCRHATHTRFRAPFLLPFCLRTHCGYWLPVLQVLPAPGSAAFADRYCCRLPIFPAPAYCQPCRNAATLRSPFSAGCRCYCYAPRLVYRIPLYRSPRFF